MAGMLYNVRPVIVLILAACVLVMLTGAVDAANRKSWWAAVFPPANSIAANTIAQQATMLAGLVPLPADAAFEARVDAARTLIHSHTQHRIDKEFYSYWAQMPFLIRLVRNHAVAQPPQNAQLPHAECSTRSALLYHLLKAMGIRARLVVIYPDSQDKRSHTFVEAYNPATQKWQITDADMNVYWQNARDQKRADIAAIMNDDRAMRDGFTPCTGDGTCVWFDRVENIRDYFGLAAIIDPAADHVDLLVNDERYDRRRLFTFMKTRLQYCALYAQRDCRYRLANAAD